MSLASTGAKRTFLVTLSFAAMVANAAVTANAAETANAAAAVELGVNLNDLRRG